jgi:hypothetical protein
MQTLGEPHDPHVSKAAREVGEESTYTYICLKSGLFHRRTHYNKNQLINGRTSQSNELSTAETSLFMNGIDVPIIGRKGVRERNWRTYSHKDCEIKAYKITTVCITSGEINFVRIR